MNKEQVFLDLVDRGELEIDSQGRVWRLKIRGGNPNRNPFVKPCPKRRLEYKHKLGYLVVTTNVEKKRIVTGAHRLVWTYFNGPIPEGLTINHKNGVKDDNRPANLELATYSEQRHHAIKVLGARHHDVRGSKHPKTKLTEEMVREMRAMREQGTMVKEIAARYSMKTRAVSAICNHRTWKHI